MLIVVFWAALFLVVYTYLIYPVLLWLLAAGPQGCPSTRRSANGPQHR